MKTIPAIPFILAVFLLSGSAGMGAQTSPILSENDVLKLAGENVEKYRMGDAMLQFTDADGIPVKGIELKIRQISQDFLFGALAFDLVEGGMEPAEEDLFKERFSDLFNFTIFPFYWGGYEPTAGHPHWDRIDRVLEWCLENGITCKGHPLGWTHEIGLPGYVLDLTLEESEILLQSRIIENVTGFRDRITLWDVVK